ncbi:MAG: DUF1801 domain-containing protein [Myxococcaceae bacterium]|nr:DUF1801 domain-containing protein [Myxococcaceae bacterium]
MPKAKTVAEYLAAQPPAARKVLKEVRAALKKALPKADEVISYSIPAFRQHDRIVIYFAGWRDHFSVYPVSRAAEAAFAKELAKLETSGRGTLRIPYEGKLPVKLISAFAKFRLKEVEPKPKKTKR